MSFSNLVLLMACATVVGDNNGQRCNNDRQGKAIINE